jgi:hypothetical protein
MRHVAISTQKTIVFTVEFTNYPRFELCKTGKESALDGNHKEIDRPVTQLAYALDAAIGLYVAEFKPICCNVQRY